VCFLDPQPLARAKYAVRAASKTEGTKTNVATVAQEQTADDRPLTGVLFHHRPASAIGSCRVMAKAVMMTGGARGPGFDRAVIESRDGAALLSESTMRILFDVAPSALMAP